MPTNGHEGHDMGKPEGVHAHPRHQRRGRADRQRAGDDRRAPAPGGDEQDAGHRQRHEQGQDAGLRAAQRQPVDLAFLEARLV